jgi:eukaryotic-like serine/threonine-protein kinase
VLAVVAVIQFAPWKSKAAPEPAATAPATSPAAQQASQPPASQAPAQQPAAQPPVQNAASPAPPQIPVQKPASPPATKQARQMMPQTSAPPVTDSHPAASSQTAQQPPAATSPAQPPAPQPAAPAGPSRAELQDAREHLMMLGTRAAGVRTTLQTLQRQQAASGLNLRGDMQEAANLMNSYLEGANSALNAGDLPAARTFADKAERQLEKLEKFLNR